MINPLVKFTTDESDETKKVVYVSALHVAGIEPAALGGSVIYYANTSVTVEEDVKEVYASFENKLREMTQGRQK